MRVIAGEFRSRLLRAPRGVMTRPTSDRLRETLFNVLAPRLEGARFLDLYAGSGANGIEALSRGAAHAVFVEQAPPAIEAIRANVEMLGLGARATVERRAVVSWLRAAAGASTDAFEVVFLDPPYDHAEEYAAVMQSLGGEAFPLLAQGAIVVAEHRRSRSGAGQELAGSYGRLTRTRLLEQGDAALSFFAAAERA